MRRLSPENYFILKEQLEKITFNCFFARSVIERHVNGTVYVDDEDMPTNAYILHPYGMALLIGDGKGDEFRDRLTDYMLNISKVRKRDEWMQIFSDNWQSVIETTINNRLLPAEKNADLNYSDYVEVNTRVNFKFNKTRFVDERRDHLYKGVEIIRLDKKATISMHGGVIPLNFWNNADDFLEKGTGFSVFVNGEQASTAYSAFIHGIHLEIGIETVNKFRGLGYAKLACRALIDYCMKNGLEPVWSCRLENVGSYNLATRLGFEPTLRLPYYRLCKTNERSTQWK